MLILSVWASWAVELHICNVWLISVIRPTEWDQPMVLSQADIAWRTLRWNQLFGFTSNQNMHWGETKSSAHLSFTVGSTIFLKFLQLLLTLPAFLFFLLQFPLNFSRNIRSLREKKEKKQTNPLLQTKLSFILKLTGSAASDSLNQFLPSQ